MKLLSLLLSVFLISTLSFGQDSSRFQTEIGIRTKKQVGFYWVNGITTEWSTSKIASGSFHLGLNITSSYLGSAFRSNAIPTLETELSFIKYFRYSKSLQPITRLNLGFAKAFYGTGFSSIPSTGMLCSIETGVQYNINKLFSGSLYGGYNLLYGNGITGLSTVYPIYYGVGLKYRISD
jgi:hypothetical protein